MSGRRARSQALRQRYKLDRCRCDCRPCELGVHCNRVCEQDRAKVLSHLEWPRAFSGYRPGAPADYAGKGLTNGPGKPDYEGAVFSDGTVVIRWLTVHRSVAVFATWSDFAAVHGHPDYETRIVFADGRLPDGSSAGEGET